MKTLRNNFTTPKQSKQLINLGVPKNSADCYYYDWAWHEDGEFYGRGIQICDYGFLYENMSNKCQIFPCWSVGRLIEIILLCCISNEPSIVFKKSLCGISKYKTIEWCIKVLNDNLRDNFIDFNRFRF